MAEWELDVLVGTSFGNQFWLSGFRGSGGPQTLAPFLTGMVTPRIVLPLSGEPALLGLRSAARAYEIETHIADIQPMVSPTSEMPKLVRTLLAKRGLNGGRIGIDRTAPGALTDTEFSRLQAELSTFELIDATDLFVRLRMIKTEAEIACLRHAVEIQNDAFRLFLSRASRRMSDVDIKWELIKAQMESGASEPGLVLLAGHPAAALFAAASDEPCPETGLRWLDSGAIYKGYTSDYDMLVAWGEPSAEVLSTHAVMRDSYDAAMQAWRPGRTFVDIARDTAAALQDHGLSDPLGGAFIGHNLGCEVVERPWFGIRAPRGLVLEPGMVIAPEWLTTTPLGEFLWEENFLVTETGLERLTDYGPELSVVAD